jgi:hypothetical protein
MALSARAAAVSDSFHLFVILLTKHSGLFGERSEPFCIGALFAFRETAGRSTTQRSDPTHARANAIERAVASR